MDMEGHVLGSVQWKDDKRLNLYNKSGYVCLFVTIYVPYSRPNGWADRDET